jgi:hypothetical protein
MCHCRIKHTFENHRQAKNQTIVLLPKVVKQHTRTKLEEKKNLCPKEIKKHHIQRVWY